MNLKHKLYLLALPLLLSGMTEAAAQTGFGDRQAEWLAKSEACRPILHERAVKPVGLVELRENPDAFQKSEMIPAGTMDRLYDESVKKMSGVIVDFGEHVTGHFSCRFELLNSHTSEAPVRLKFTFVEVPGELSVPADPYPGTLSRAWIQDEVVTVDYIPNEITIPRRLAFRYVKIEVTAHSYFDFRIADMSVTARTSASSTPEPLAPGTPAMIAEIDRVGLATLRECMQTVYEDGPKRDLRLWIGDLYLEALANMYSYRNHALTKRCLYLLAGLADEEGFLHASVFDKPAPHPETGQHILDYALLWNTSLLDYLKATGDRETALDMWPVAKRQLEIARTYLDDRLLYNEKPVWIFFDWRSGFDPRAALQGLLVKTFRDTYELARMLGKQQEIAYVPGLTNKIVRATRKQLYDSRTGLVVSGPDKQVSYVSQVWAVLGDILTPAEARRALKTVMQTPDAVYPGTPYATHFLIEAMLHCGMVGEAKDYLVGYWGDMVRKKADTFWEVYDAHDDYLSPYNFFPINSYCHAWSCTPVYFIRKYPEIFQR